ncbi:MAG: DUF255 domain-containing protein, partial [Planctomycetota bacterium]
ISTMIAKTALVLGLLAATAGQQDPPGREANRLIDETSPYLLQHAYNPVHWYPWGPEAFAAAREQDKPIFLSVGYSTCYWCHVMERESFEDPKVAALMNEHFISIKVDREERPDVDEVYLTGVQAIAGRGGWPMSVFLEPRSLKPFAGGTYFPPRAGHGKPSFTELLGSVRDQWRDDRAAVRARADEVGKRVARALSVTFRPQPLGPESVDSAAASLMAAYDAVHGGFRRGKPKFPQPVQLELLMAVAWDDLAIRDALVHTLDRMAMGGIHDQVGGGFHRYSTDQRWLVPHFEKMLYDNAQLASVYAKAYELTGDAFYAEVVEETLDYVLREMTSADGAFYSAQDAEANEREGASYVWTPAQVRRALDDAGVGEQFDFAEVVYGLTARGNFIDPHHRAEAARNVLYLPGRPEVIAGKLGLDLEDFNQRLSLVNAALLVARDGREQPITDDKVLAEWNGLMIAAMVDGARALGEPRYLEAARRAATFVLENMRSEDGGLRRAWRSGQARVDGFSSDYAHFVRGLVALHRGTGERVWLDQAVELARVAGQKFRDERSGVYYDTLAGQPDLFVRVATTRDGVVPCANSVMLMNLLDLYELTGEASWLDEASETLGGLSSRIHRSPRSTALATVALHRFLSRHPERVSGESPGPAAPAPEPVKILSSPRTVAVSPDVPGVLRVTLKIDEGYHLSAHDPGVAGLIGLSIRVVGQGLTLEVEYPPGEPFRNRLFEDDLLVHTGAVTLPLTVRQTGPGQGRAALVVTYQVCTDQVCLQPVEQGLPVTITRGSQ